MLLVHNIQELQKASAIPVIWPSLLVTERLCEDPTTALDMVGRLDKEVLTQAR